MSSVAPSRAIVVFLCVALCTPTFISIGLVPRNGSANLKSVCMYACIYIYVSTFHRVARLPLKDFYLMHHHMPILNL